MQACPGADASAPAAEQLLLSAQVCTMLAASFQTA